MYNLPIQDTIDSIKLSLAKAEKVAADFQKSKDNVALHYTDDKGQKHSLFLQNDIAENAIMKQIASYRELILSYESAKVKEVEAKEEQLNDMIFSAKTRKDFDAARNFLNGLYFEFYMHNIANQKTYKAFEDTINLQRFSILGY